MKGTALGGGADWILVRPDGVSELNVRVTLRTDDEQLDYTDLSRSALHAERRRTVLANDADLRNRRREVPWLNKIIAVGVGKTVPGKAAYSVYHIL